MNIVGVDYSLRSPGICIITDSNVKLHFLTEKPKWEGVILDGGKFSITGHTYPFWSNDQERHDKIANWVMSLLPEDCVCGIEGYAFASTSSRLFQIGEHTGCLKQKLWHSNIPFEIFQPAAVKKFATSKGNAKKDLMVETFIGQYNLDIGFHLGMKPGKVDSPVSDMVDAFFIAKILECQHRGNLVS